MNFTFIIIKNNFKFLWQFFACLLLWIFFLVCLPSPFSIWVPFETLRNYLLRENRFWHSRRKEFCLLFTNWMFADGILCDLLDMVKHQSSTLLLPSHRKRDEWNWLMELRVIADTEKLWNLFDDAVNWSQSWCFYEKDLTN